MSSVFYSVTSVHPIDTYEDENLRAAAEQHSARKAEQFGDNVQHVWERRPLFNPETTSMIEMMLLATTVTIEMEEQ